MKKSVIMISSQFPPVYGGAGSQAELLSNRLARRGWDVEIVTLDQKGVGSSHENGIRVRRILRGVAATGRLTRIQTTVGLSVAAAIAIVKKRPLVVHIHGTYWWSIAPVLAARLVGAASVVKSTRDGEDDAATVFAKRWGRVPLGRIYGASLRLADAVIVLNEVAMKSAISQGLSTTTRLIRNGVNVESFTRSVERREKSRAEERLSKADRVVLFVGYLVKHKGVEDLLTAWRTIGDQEAQLWLIGPMTGFYRELDDRIPQEIVKLIDDGFKVRQFGHVEGDRLPHFYWAADVFVLPSYAEGMPNSLAEAVVSGCEIVATAIPGITDILEQHEAAFFAPGDLESLETALKKALLGGRHDSSSAAARLNIENVTDSYEDLYDEIGAAS